MENKLKRAFDLSQFKRIEDIIYLDEPILTHLKKGWKDYFMYLVKTNENSDVYLLFEITEMDIYSYLTHNKSLWEIIVHNEEFIFIIEQDFEGKVVDYTVSSAEHLDKGFLPSKDSFFEYNPTENSHYYKFLEELRAQSYLLNLRKDAFYLKISPKNDKYGDTLGFMELSNHLLNNISSSYGSFIEADFHAEFKERITDQKKLNKSFKKIKDDLDYRMVDLNYGSFEIGLAIDRAMKTDINRKDIFEWAVEVGTKFKDVVLDKDYNREKVDSIIKKYSALDRKKIFEPIFKITQDQNFTLSKRESNEVDFHALRVKEKSLIDRILPVHKEVSKKEDQIEFKVVKLTTVIDSKKSKKSIKLDQNTLFNATDSSDYMLHQEDFKKLGYDVRPDIEIPLQIYAQGGNIKLEAILDTLKFESISSSMEDGIKKITSKLYEYLLNKNDKE